jgi:hypothetical protein
MANVGGGSEKCFRRPHNVSLNPSPIVTTHFNASKISHSTSLPSPKLSLFSQNIGGDLFSSICLLNSTSLLLDLSLNCSKAFIASFCCSKRYKEIYNEKKEKML